MNITAFIMGICPKQRLDWLDKNITYLESQQFPFEEKILAIDQFNGNIFPKELEEKYIKLGWKLLIDSHHSRAKTMSNALSEVKTPYIFYNEDDVLSTMPKIEDIERCFNIKIEERECGMISMALGGTNFEAKDNYIGDLEFIDKNTIVDSDTYKIFKRLESTANSYFFEFPGLFIKTELFKKCHQDSLTRFKGHQIEQGLTLAYFKNRFQKKFNKASICKENALEILKSDPFKLNSHCRLLKDLDPLQGNNPHGGNLIY